MECVINTSQYSNLAFIILYSVYSSRNIDFARGVNEVIGNMYNRTTVKLSIALIDLFSIWNGKANVELTWSEITRDVIKKNKYERP